MMNKSQNSEMVEKILKKLSMKAAQRLACSALGGYEAFYEQLNLECIVLTLTDEDKK